MKNGPFTTMFIEKDPGNKRHEPTLAITKSDHTPKKFMMCILWERNGNICYERLQSNHSINSEMYCSELGELKSAIEETKCR